MKTMIFIGLLGAVLLTAGCVGTVTGGNTSGTHYAKDQLEGVYKRSVDEVFNAAKTSVEELGIVTKHGTLNEQTNVVKFVEGKINEGKIWIRVEGVDPKTTSVAVQARTKNGHADIETAHQIEKNIALKLVH